MELLRERDLVDKEGRRVSVSQALKDKTVVAFYFSAHWCPPCRQFTPMLASAYQASRAPGQGGGVEVVFVSSDRSQSDMQSYMRESHGSWLALPHGDPFVQTLSSKFGVRGIPALKVVAVSDGTEICMDGRQEVMAKGPAAFSSWEKLAPSPLDLTCVNLLLDNGEEVRKDASEILIKLFENVVRDPENIKYRQVKLGNKKIEEKLLPANGAFEILFSAGFEEAEDKLLLPLSANITNIKKFLEAIRSLSSPPVKKTESPAPHSATPVSSQAASTATTSSSSSSTVASVSPNSVPLLMPDVLTREKEFLQRLTSGLRHMDQYERTVAQEAARAVMPVSRFEAEAKRKLDLARSKDEGLSELLYRDLLLLEFKEWFKTDFFSWLDKPVCPQCGGETESRGMCAPTSQESADGAGRVEGYVCKKCGAHARFPRYHARPEKLLETRRGRCGEWANCFVLCCRALGFDTRHVHDWTDHVWAEVWSEAEGRWLHVDPGETVDKPLVYEAGWGKKLTYVIACSKDEVQDVTWRYSKDHKETKGRRSLVRPRWLLKTLLQLTQSKIANRGEDERNRLMERRLVECTEMLTAREVAATDKVGRQTGSLAWRLARGEMGTQEVNKEEGYVFSPTDEEIAAGLMEAEYDCAEDKYYRTVGGVRNVLPLDGLGGGVNSLTNVARKVEADWNKVYLARVEGNCEKGSLCWKFALPREVEVGRVEVLVGSSTFSTGRVIWTLCGGTSCLLPQPGVRLETDQLTGSKELSLTAIMSGGEGECAWQHTQLFRCDRDGAGEAPQLKVTINFKNSEETEDKNKM